MVKTVRYFQYSIQFISFKTNKVEDEIADHPLMDSNELKGEGANLENKGICYLHLPYFGL